MSKLEILDVDKLIYDTLIADSDMITAMGGEIRLHADLAPENQANLKWIIFELFDGRDVAGVGGVHVFSKPMYLIKVCGRDTGYQVLKDACERLNFLLTDEHHGIVNDTWVGKFVRRRVMRDVDNLKNLRVYWIGQLYELMAYDVS